MGNHFNSLVLKTLTRKGFVDILHKKEKMSFHSLTINDLLFGVLKQVKLLTSFSLFKLQFTDFLINYKLHLINFFLKKKTNIC